MNGGRRKKEICKSCYASSSSSARASVRPRTNDKNLGSPWENLNTAGLPLASSPIETKVAASCLSSSLNYVRFLHMLWFDGSSFPNPRTVGLISPSSACLGLFSIHPPNLRPLGSPSSRPTSLLPLPLSPLPSFLPSFGKTNIRAVQIEPSCGGRKEGGEIESQKADLPIISALPCIG